MMTELIGEGKLKDIDLIKNEDGRYYLDVTYQYENDFGIYELNMPRVALPFTDSRIPNIIPSTPYAFGDCDMTIEDLECVLPLSRFKFEDYEGCVGHYCIKTIKEKPKKMTLSEIEKKLGYKIELVSQKE